MRSVGREFFSSRFEGDFCQVASLKSGLLLPKAPTPRNATARALPIVHAGIF